MEDKKFLIESLFEKIKEYLNTSIDLVKLKAIEKVSDICSSLAIRLSILLIFSMFFLFLSIGVSFWLGELLGEVYYGFLIVAAFYLVVAILLLLMYKPMKKSVADIIVKEALK